MKTTLGLALMSVTATLCFLGLAVLGWGGFAAFFSHPALIAMTVATFALAGAGWFSSGNLSPGEREDRSNRWVLIAFAARGRRLLRAGYRLLDAGDTPEAVPLLRVMSEYLIVGLWLKQHPDRLDAWALVDQANRDFVVPRLHG